MVLIGLGPAFSYKNPSGLWNSLKSFKCTFTLLTNSQANDFPRLEQHQKRNKENDQLKDCKPGTMTREPHREEIKARPTGPFAKNQRSHGSHRAAAEGSANALRFESLIKRGETLRNNQPPMGSFTPMMANQDGTAVSTSPKNVALKQTM